MKNNLSSFLLNQSWMKIVQVLHVTGRERSLREIATLSGIPPATTSDIVSKLESAKILRRSSKKSSRGRKVFFKLHLTESESFVLDTLVYNETKRKLNEQANAFSQKAKHTVEWIDQTFEMIQSGKKHIDETT